MVVEVVVSAAFRLLWQQITQIMNIMQIMQIVQIIQISQIIYCIFYNSGMMCCARAVSYRQIPTMCTRRSCIVQISPGNVQIAKQGSDVPAQELTIIQYQVFVPGIRFRSCSFSLILVIAIRFQLNSSELFCPHSGLVKTGYHIH